MEARDVTPSSAVLSLVFGFPLMLGVNQKEIAIKKSFDMFLYFKMYTHLIR